jgi:pseudo-rSAM protein
MVDFPVDEKILLNCISNSLCKNTHFHFIIRNASDVAAAEAIIEKHNLQHIDIHPFYDGKNVDFFREHVFLNKNDIFAVTVAQRKIFCNQALNSNFFGGLTVFPNGDVAANTHSAILGNIKKAPLLEIITKELEQNTAWRKTRSEKPCNRCLYQYLCPPPSNYETAFQRMNLCAVQS